MKSKKTKKVSRPGRVRLNCSQCKAEFSTHSSNRTKCYKCLPKCTELHVFLPNSKKKKSELVKEDVAE